MPAVTVLHGFQVSLSILDALLSANGLSDTDLITQIVSPSFSSPTWANMGAAGDVVYAQWELRDGDFPSEVPPAFNGLRDEVLLLSKTPNDQIDGQIGHYVVFTEKNNYILGKMQQRNLIVSPRASIALLNTALVNS